MAFHKSNLHGFGDHIISDKNGYVPTKDTGPWELAFDHGSELSHDEDGNLTGYGEWWESDGFPALREQAIRETAEAEAAISDWLDEA